MDAWLNGQTGFPIIDACMRCLQTTGFINFRMRAMIVSFACFVLHISWKEINYPLAKLFIDYEPGIHISQLQMQAGVVGINTIRVYSPIKQAIDQDPNAIFIKKWVPELKNFTPAEIHNFHKVNLSGYSAPIVKELINKGVIYVGVSAGSYVACPTIEMALWKNPEIDTLGLKDFNAMNLVDSLVVAHYKEELKDILRENSKNTKFKIKVLKDDQALLIQNMKIKLLGNQAEVNLNV